MFDSSCIILPIWIGLGTSCPGPRRGFFDVSKVSGRGTMTLTFALIARRLDDMGRRS